MHIQSIGSKLSGLLLLFVCLLLSWQVKAQPGFESRIVIQVDDPSVVATVDNPNAAEGATVTLTLSGLSSGKTAMVTAGLLEGMTDYQVTPVPGKSNAYTLIMPSSVLYIHVKVTNAGQVIRIQTPGIAASLATVSLSIEGNKSAIIPGTTIVAPGSKVKATLNLTSTDEQKLTLERITGKSPDGSWVMVPTEVKAMQSSVDPADKTIEFTMPESEVILSYAIHTSAVIKTEPTEDTPDADPVEVPEVAWPNQPAGDPVLVITKQIEEDKLQLLSEQLQQHPALNENEGAITELVDISLQLETGERVQPNGAVTVTYPYPQGTDATWNFCLLHQISDKEGEAIKYETIYPKSLHIGLRFDVTSFSPFALIYTPPVLPEGVTQPVRVEGISLNKNSLTLGLNENEQLVVTFQPTDATDQRISWSSDNEQVLTVSTDGTLRAVSTGTALVTARSMNGGFQATCRVTVKDNSIPDPDPEPSPDPDPDPDPDPTPDPPVANADITQDAPRLSVADGCLQVESPRAVTVQVFGLSGNAQTMRSSAVSHRIALPSGIWLVSIDGAKAVKIVVP